MAVALGLSRNLPCALYLAWCSIAERASNDARRRRPVLGLAPGMLPAAEYTVDPI